jgi:hypothetical protein
MQLTGLCEEISGAYSICVIIAVAPVASLDRITAHLSILPVLSACAGMSVQLLPISNPDEGVKFIVQVHSHPQRLASWLPVNSPMIILQ